MNLGRLSVGSFLAWLTVLSLFAAFFELGRMDVLTDNEGQRAGPPQEMIASGDYIVPTINGKPYLAKPPLLYWAIVGVYRATGQISEWNARLPTALAAICLVFATYFFFRRVASEETARWTALFMLASPYVLERARWANLDIPLTLATFGAIAFLFRAWRSPSAGPRYAWALCAGLSLGAATMLKGPVPYLFVGAAAYAYIIISGLGREKVIRQSLQWTAICFGVEVVFWPVPIQFPVALVLLVVGWFVLGVHRCKDSIKTVAGPLGLALVVAVACAAPWAWLVVQRYGWEQTQTLLQGEVVERTHTATKINSGSPFYFLLGLPLMAAPWGFLLPLHAVRGLTKPFSAELRWSLLTGWLSVAVFSLIAGKEYEYVMPGLAFLLAPTAEIVRGFLAEPADDSLGGRWFRYWRLALFPLLAVVLLGLPIYGAIAVGGALLVAELVGLAVVGFVLLWLGRSGKSELVFAATLVTVLAIVGGLTVRSFNYREQNSPKMISRLCRTLIDEGAVVESSRIYPALAFYIGRPVAEERLPATLLKQAQRPEPYYYLTRVEFVERIAEATDGALRPVMGPMAPREFVLMANEAGAQRFDEI